MTRQPLSPRSRGRPAGVPRSLVFAPSARQRTTTAEAEGRRKHARPAFMAPWVLGLGGGSIEWFWGRCGRGGRFGDRRAQMPWRRCLGHSTRPPWPAGQGSSPTTTSVLVLDMWMHARKPRVHSVTPARPHHHTHRARSAPSAARREGHSVAARVRPSIASSRRRRRCFFGAFGRAMNYSNDAFIPIRSGLA